MVMLQYMVSYQFIGAVALSITFYLDGSSFSRLQQGAIDFIAMTMAFVTAAQVPKRELQRIRPDQRVSTVPKYIILMVSAICCFIAQLAVAVLLCTRPWYTGGTGSADQVGTHLLCIDCLAQSCIKRLHGMQPRLTA